MKRVKSIIRIIKITIQIIVVVFVSIMVFWLIFLSPDTPDTNTYRDNGGSIDIIDKDGHNVGTIG